MGVVHGGGAGGVAGALLHGVHGHAVVGADRGAGVSRVVQRDVRDVDLSAQCPEPVGECLRIVGEPGR